VSPHCPKSDLIAFLGSSDLRTCYRRHSPEAGPSVTYRPDSINAIESEAALNSEARTGNAVSYDRLSAIAAHGGMPEGARAKAEADIKLIRTDSRALFFRVGQCPDPSKIFANAEHDLSSKDEQTVLNSMRCLSPSLIHGDTGGNPVSAEKRVEVEKYYPLVPQIAELALSSPSMFVRYQASFALCDWTVFAAKKNTRGDFEMFDTARERLYWTQYRALFER
jgi:hypothetical protein